MDMKMERDEYELDNSSDEDITDYLYTSLQTHTADVNNTEPEAYYQSNPAENEKMAKKAELFLEGGVSFYEYEAFVKEKPIGAERVGVPPAVASLIGQANMTFVRGQYEDTLRLCKEAIRHVPYSGEPYRTLSEMYEELGDRERGLQLGMIASALSGNASNWVALGEKALELGKIKEAAYCYTEAVKKDCTEFDAHVMRIKLYTELGDTRSLIAAYHKLVEGALPAVGSPILEYAKAGAQFMHAENDVKGALSLMDTAFHKVPNAVTSDDVNLILELCLAMQKYEQSLEIITQHCNVEIEAEENLVKDRNTEEVSTCAFRVINCKINTEIPHQIRTKLAIVLINLKALHLIDGIVAPLLDVVEEFGDLLLDVAEALMHNNMYVEALKLIRILVNDENMTNAAQVWLDYAECLKSLGRKEEAVTAYLEVMERAPHQVDSRFVVSDLLNELGRSEEALNALTQDPGAGSLDVGMLFERCSILKGNPQRIAEFLAVGRLLLSRHCARIKARKDVTLFTRFSGTHRRVEVQKRLPVDDETEEVPTYVEGRRMPTGEEEWRLFTDICQSALDNKQFGLLQRMAFSALGSDFLCRNPMQECKIRIIATLACLFNKDSHHGYNLIRQLILSGFDNSRAWSIFNLIIKQTEELRHQKFIIRLLARKPSHSVLPVLFANNCFMAGSYKQAVSEYLLLFKNDKSPFTALMIAITFVQLASQKHANNVNTLVAQSMAFVSDYKRLRGDECAQEIHYNIGRLYHHIGLLPPAIYHYKTALDTPAPCEMFDLKREAAYNLSIIYQLSGANDLARYYIDKYIVV